MQRIRGEASINRFSAGAKLTFENAGFRARDPNVKFAAWAAGVLMALLVISGCGTSPYNPEAGVIDVIAARSVTQSQGNVRVRVSVPSPEETRQLFDIALYDKDVQPVWIEVENKGQTGLRYTPFGTDPEYFTPSEIAYANRRGFTRSAREEMQFYFHDTKMPRVIRAGEIKSGFVFTEARTGTKDVNVDLYGPGEDETYSFIFFVRVPGFVADYEQVEFDSLYKPSETMNLNSENLRTALKTLPCCATALSGGERKDPLNVIMIGDGLDVLQALLRAGWLERAAEERRTGSPAEAAYLFGRTGDAIFNQPRSGQGPRTGLRLWMSPMRVDGKPVWVGNIANIFLSRNGPIGIGPDIDDARNFVLQDLLYAQGVAQYAWLRGPLYDPEGTLSTNLQGSDYFTDGYLIVIWPTGDPQSILEARLLPWDEQPQ